MPTTTGCRIFSIPNTLCILKPTISFVFAGFFLLPLLGLAQDPRLDLDEPWVREYGWVEFGGALMPDLDARLGLRGTGLADSDVTLKFGPGFSVNGGIGQRFSEWFGAEIQGGFLYHNIDEVSSPDASLRTLDASLLQVPVFFNLVFELPIKTRIMPYAGVGAGAMVNWLNIDDRIAAGPSGVVSVEDSSTEINFAYQAFVGARMRMGAQGTIELTYRFMGANSPNWSLKEATTGGTIGSLKADDIYVHALTLGFLVEF